MPSIKITGADELVMVLNRLSEESEGAIKKAVFDGAAVIADAVRSNINGLRVDGPSAWETRRRTEQKAGLQAGLTTYQIEDKGGKIEGGVAAELAGRLQFDAENGKGSYLKARSSEIYNMLVKRFKLEKPQKRARMVAKTDEPEDDEE